MNLISASASPHYGGGALEVGEEGEGGRRQGEGGDRGETDRQATDLSNKTRSPYWHTIRESVN